MKMTFKFLQRKSFWTHAIVAAVAILVVIAIETVPAFLGNRLLPSLAASAGIEGIEAKVNKLWFGGAELNRVRLLVDGKRTISVDSIRLQYRLPLWPFQRNIKIKSVMISGLRVNVIEENGKIIIPGLPKEWFASKKKTQKKAKAPLFSIQRIILRDSMIRFERSDDIFEIPFSVYLNMPAESTEPIKLFSEIQFMGDKLKLRSQWQADSGAFGVDIEGNLRSGNYLRLFPQMQGKFWGGTEFNGKFAGNYKIGMQYPENLTGLLNFTSLRFVAGAIHLDIKPETPLILKITGSEYELSGLHLAKPLKAEFDQIAGTVISENHIIKVTNNTIVKIVAAGNPTLNLTNDITAVYSGHAEWDIAHKNIIATGNCAVPALQYGMIKADGLALEFKAELKSGVPSANAKIAIPAATIPKIKLKTGLIELNTAWTLADKKTNSIGKLQIDGVSLHNYQVDNLNWQVMFNHNSLSLKGTFKQNILPDTKCTNLIDFEFSPKLKITASAQVSHPPNASPVNLKSFAPTLPALDFSGNVELGGTWSWVGGKQNCAAEIMVKDGKITGKELDLSADGISINTKVFIIPEIETPALQDFGCGKLSIGKLVFENIQARFQVEHGKEFLLEDFSAGWCGGKVFTQSLRFNPNVKETRAVIYCDSLNLAEILNQTGIAHAQGDGKLHGRLPLRFGADGINFEQGFLYSVPGETRNIRLSGLEKRLEGIDPATAQYAQLDLASEALKDFDYEWIKFDFNNDGDYLTVNSQFNGRPKQPLPFAFDQGKGGFIRSGQQTAKFQGIKLDLNSSFPLNRLVDLNKKFKQYFQRRAK